MDCGDAQGRSQLVLGASNGGPVSADAHGIECASACAKLHSRDTCYKMALTRQLQPAVEVAMAAVKEEKEPRVVCPDTLWAC